MRIRAILAALSGAAALCTTAAVSAAPASADSGVQALAVTYLADHPGGTLIGDTVEYPDGTLFVAVAAGVDSLSQCPSGSFCMWSAASYTGSFVSVSGQALRVPLSNTVFSVWNNRSFTANLFNSDASASMCIAVGEEKPTLAAAYHQPARVRLTAQTAC